MGQLLIALAGTLLLVAVAHGLGLRRDDRLASPTEARERLRLAAPEFADGPLAVSLDGRALLACGPDGRMLLARVQGDRLAVRWLTGDAWQRHTASLVSFTASGIGQPAAAYAFRPRALDSVLASVTPQSA